MPTQEQFVRWCEDYYFDNRLEPGNPCHGDWESCHYPVPKCLGGSNIVFLLKEHHAIQGVLQSEECNYPCIWGWEKSYLDGEILPLWKKWMAIKAQPAIEAWKKIPTEIKSEKGRKAQSLISKESLRRGWEGMMKTLTPEKRRQACEKANQTKLSKDPEFFSNHARRMTRELLAKNPLHFSDMGKKARKLETSEVKSARGHNIPKDAKSKGREKTNSRRVRCLVTGKISTPGPLTRYQTARGIDPSLREEITND